MSLFGAAARSFNSFVLRFFKDDGQITTTAWPMGMDHSTVRVVFQNRTDAVGELTVNGSGKNVSAIRLYLPSRCPCFSALRYSLFDSVDKGKTRAVRDKLLRLKKEYEQWMSRTAMDSRWPDATLYA